MIDSCRSLIIVTAVSIFAGLLCGCGKDPHAAQIKAIEIRLAQLEEDSKAMDKIMIHNEAEFRNRLGEMNESNSNLTTLVLNMGFTLAMHAGDSSIHRTNPAARVLYQAAPLNANKPRPSATRDGVPVAIYDQIAADAIKRYPTDYDMQVSIIKWQIEAYRKLHP